ncbi:MAG: hypothetical protein M1819_005531 [Sarea resinae]|nr:MAG: hypothetical protein M1819_005531 [Sarea resinae]
MGDLAGDEFNHLVKQLVDGFEALYEEMQLSTSKRRRVESKLSAAQIAFREAVQRHPDDVDLLEKAEFLENDHGDMDSSEAYLWLKNDLRGKGSGQDRRAHASILEALGARDRLQSLKKGQIKQGSSPGCPHASLAPNTTSPLNSPPRPREPALHLEEDFTRRGKEGNLQCPFSGKGSKPFSRRPSALKESVRPHLDNPRSLPTPPHTKDDEQPHRRHSSIDPIQLELHPEQVNSPPASVEGSLSKCPIRFLDQHSPEEVAKYFENHKHEIPRSHEICVKRYQSNSESIRQLDAKYGNLVSMIQGLGSTHQPMLASKPESGAEEQKSMEKVANWAKTVSSSLDGMVEPGAGMDTDTAVEPKDDEERQGRFDRPLKDIRLGESPSRPWGIPVPINKEKTQTAPGSETSTRRVSADQSAANKGVSTLPESASFSYGNCRARKVTSNVGGSKNVDPVLESPESQREGDVFSHNPRPKTPSPSNINTHSAPRMVFTGPVFIGYSAEQAAELLQRNGSTPASQQ